jgi:hypothetical protein
MVVCTAAVLLHQLWLVVRTQLVLSTCIFRDYTEGQNLFVQQG